MWIQALGGLLLFVASFLVIRAVIAADEAAGAATAVPRRRRARSEGLRRAA
jgi:hypothetical protein